MKYFLFFISVLPLFGGESVNGVAASATCTAYTQANNVRFEIYIHNWPDTTVVNQRFATPTCIGIDLRWTSTAGQMEITSTWGLGGSGTLRVQLDHTTKAAYIRSQWTGSTRTLTNEVWDYDGTLRASTTYTFGSLAGGFSGIELNGTADATTRIAFMRAHTDLVPLNSRPPVTFDNANRIFEYKFDGDLTEEVSGNNFTPSGGSAVYNTTPYQITVSKIKTYDAPSWSDWISFRAGTSNQLDGSSSYSQADTSAAVTYFWTQTSGPSRLAFSDRTASQPTVSGATFGTYTIRLVATSVGDGTSATTDFEIGSVATDSNGIVVPNDTRVSQVFGDMIAFGRNPWGYMDYKALQARPLREATYLEDEPITVDGNPAPRWAEWQTGTVNYVRQGRTTTLSGSITDSATTITVGSVANLDLTTLPGTPIILTNQYYTGGEFIRICSASGTTLTVCYDGRGWANSTAAAHNNGTTFYQLDVKGTGTSFLTTLCPAGAGISGTINYNTGTVSVTAGSTSITGSGTSWTSSQTSRVIRISGTHSGGTPFVFISTVSSVNSGTSITLSRAFPASADSASGLSYSILNNDRQIGLEWNHPYITPGGDSPLISNAYGMATTLCESDTIAYGQGWTEAVGTATESSRRYVVSDTNWVGDFGPNYYDEVLANYAGYFRSGWTPWLNTARTLARYWLMQPNLGGGYNYGRPRQTSATGAAVGAALDSSAITQSSWGVMKALADDGYSARNATCSEDLRETAYRISWLALQALLNPDSAERAARLLELADTYTRDNSCKGVNNNHPSFYFPDSALTGMTLTNGSATVTGSGFTSGFCPEDATGTATFTNGSTAVTIGGGDTGTFISNSNKILVVWGARSGAPLYTRYTYNSGTSITLPTNFTATSGQYTWQIIPNNGSSDSVYLTFRNTSVDPFSDTEFGKIYSCRYVSGTEITLDRNWEGTTISGTGAGGRMNVVGIGTQPFILGIKSLSMNFGFQAGETQYETLRNDASSWMYSDSGYDSVTKGMYYFAAAPMCTPNVTPLLNCSIPETSDFNISESRTLGAEAMNSAGFYYNADPTADRQLRVDTIYGGIWGKEGYDDPSVAPYRDSIQGVDTNGINFGSYKWSGFFFGIGMDHQWPAVRLGGLAPAQTRTNKFGFTLPSGGASAKFTVTYPSGKVETTTCGASPCSITSDARQGSQYLYYIEYLDGSDNVIARSDTQIFKVR